MTASLFLLGGARPFTTYTVQQIKFVLRKFARLPPGTLDIHEFAKGCQESRFQFTDIDIQTLFRAFDKNGDGTIDYDEFLRVVKGPMPPKRLALVKKAY